MVVWDSPVRSIALLRFVCDRAGGDAIGSGCRGKVKPKLRAQEWQIRGIEAALEDDRLAKLIKFLFGDSQLLENFIEQPATNLGIAVNWNCGGSAVWMFPTGMATFLPNLLKP
jgi:hypothetical protein